MRTLTVLLVGSCGWAVSPASVVARDDAPMVLRVYIAADVKTETVRSVRPVLRAILERAGFRMEWRECSEVPADPPCADPLGPTEFVVRILPLRPDPHTDACGVSIRPKNHIPGRLVTIYWDCVRDGGDSLHTDPAVVGAYVIAHELGHLLLPDARHTTAGLMRATLDPMDWQRASRGALRFSQTELKLMKDALARRADSGTSHDPREGSERLVVRAPDARVIRTAEGDEHSIQIDPALDRVLRTAGRHLTLTHTHPASTSLSAADLGQLAKAGVDTVEAEGADGSAYHAVAGPRYDVNRFEDVVYPAARREIERQLRSELSQTPRTDVDAHFSHLVAIALDKAGVIGYHATLSASRVQTYERNRVAFGHATEAAAAAVRRVLK